MIDRIGIESARAIYVDRLDSLNATALELDELIERAEAMDADEQLRAYGTYGLGALRGAAARYREQGSDLLNKIVECGAKIEEADRLARWCENLLSE